MNDIRRTILWVIFGFSMVLLWDQWQVYNGHKATFFPSPTTQQAAKATPTVGTASVPGSTANGAVPSAVPSAAAPTSPIAGAASLPGVGSPAPATSRERVELTTDVLKLVFDSEGGTLVHSEMLRHNAGLNGTGHFVLFDQSPDRVYVAQTGLIAAPSQAGAVFPTHKTGMAVAPGPRTLADGQDTLSLRFESPEVGGVKLVKTYTVQRGSYAVAVKHEVQNVGGAPVAPQLYLQLVRDGNKPPGESSFYSTFTGPAVYTDAKKFQKIEFTDIEKNKAEFEKTSPIGLTFSSR